MNSKEESARGSKTPCQQFAELTSQMIKKGGPCDVKKATTWSGGENYKTNNTFGCIKIAANATVISGVCEATGGKKHGSKDEGACKRQEELQKSIKDPKGPCQMKGGEVKHPIACFTLTQILNVSKAACAGMGAKK